MSRKQWSRLTVLLFFAPLFILGFLSLMDNDELMSADENRMLATKPAFSLSSWFDGSYARDFEDYYADQFPLRPLLLSANNGLASLYGIPLTEGSVEVGGVFDMGEGESLEDLYGLPSPDGSEQGSGQTPKPTQTPAAANPSPSPDTTPSPTPDTAPTFSPTPTASPTPTPSPSPTPMPDPTPTPVPTEPPAVTDDQNGGYLMVGDRILHRSYTNKERLAEYAAMLNHWQEALPDHTILSMVVPNSYPFYAPEDKITASLNQEDMISRLYDQLHPSIIAVDAYTPISQHTEEYLYFRTDHHWTARGAYRAYEGFCDAMGYTAGDISTWDSGEYSDFIGSFYPQVKHLPQAAIAAANPDRVEYFLPPTGYTATAYKAESLWENGWSIPVVNTNLSDSVTNQYMAFTNGDQALIHITTETDNNKGIVVIKESYGNAFIPYLLEHYEHIYILDYRKFNDAARGAPELRLTDLLEHCEAREIMLISYSYVPNEAKLTQWIGRMMPTDG